MSNLERIHINWNAADGYDRLQATGTDIIPRKAPTPEQLTRVLSLQRGKLFRLIGFTDHPPAEVVLEIVACDEAGLHLSTERTPLEGVYTVAQEPPPSMTLDGDYQFDLVRSMLNPA